MKPENGKWESFPYSFWGFS